VHHQEGHFESPKFGLIDQGAFDACERLAYLVEDGNAVLRDSSMTSALYQRVADHKIQVCNSGDGEACGALGLSYGVGGGVAHNYVPQDYAKAAEFYGKACNLGVAYNGCIKLGDLYKMGEGVPKSAERAGDFYVKACDLGEPFGCTEAGELYEEGLYAPQDYPRAFGFYLRACNDGDARGCDELGDMFRDGDGIGKSIPNAKFYYSKACSLSKELHLGCDDLRNLQ
jgi:uncharacterized protein